MSDEQFRKLMDKITEVGITVMVCCLGVIVFIVMAAEKIIKHLK